MKGQTLVGTEGSLVQTGHPDETVAAHARVLAASEATGRFVELASGHRIHVIEIGDGSPLVLLHGSGPTALQFLPLLERLQGVRALAVDRPGFGLSDPPTDAGAGHRETAIATVGAILDGLGLGAASILGSSTGGAWALWYALARPDRVQRLVLLGAAPLAPGTQVPPPMLGIASPPAAEPPPDPPPPSREGVVRGMGMFGEAETIARYPEQVDAMVAAASDPLASSVSFAELRSLIAPTGWQPGLAIQPGDLGRVAAPTLLIWGERDPLGGAEAARTVAASLPDARLELLPAGHAPWLGHPDRVAALVSAFVR